MSVSPNPCVERTGKRPRFAFHSPADSESEFRAQQENQARTLCVLDSQRATLFTRGLFAALGRQRVLPDEARA
jgi:hypothetical protein